MRRSEKEFRVSGSVSTLFLNECETWRLCSPRLAVDELPALERQPIQVVAPRRAKAYAADENDPAKPYAIPGTARDLTDADIAALDGKWLDRIGHPGGIGLLWKGHLTNGRYLIPA
jgi:hypothetical protein